MKRKVIQYYITHIGEDYFQHIIPHNNSNDNEPESKDDIYVIE